jgi:hypothetical protein
MQLNRAKSISTGCHARRSRPRVTSCSWPRRAKPPADRARPPEHSCDRRSQGRPRTFAPNPPLPRAACSRATRNRPRRPTNGIAAVPRPRARTLLPCPPYSGHAATHTMTGLNVVPKLPPQPPRAGHKSPSFTRVSAEPPPSAIGAVPVSSLRRTTPVSQAHLKLPPASRELARPVLPWSFHPLAGLRFPATAPLPPSVSSALRANPEPANHPSAPTRSQRSYPCHTLTSSAPFLAGIQVPAVAPLPDRRRRSSERPPPSNLWPIDPG